MASRTETLAAIEGGLWQRMIDQLRRSQRLQGWIKVGLVLLGGLMAAGAQLPSPLSDIAKMTLGLIGASMAFLGGVILLVIERDYVGVMIEARSAVMHWRQSEDDLATAIDGARILRESLIDERQQLITSNQVIEFWNRSRSLRETDVNKRLEYFLLRAVPRLVTAMKLGGDYIWTFSVFRKQTVGGVERMVRVASCWKERSSEDEDRRSWGLGKGWTGKAWQRGANGDKDPYVIEDDAATVTAKARYDVGDQEEPDDYERFRSVVAIPIAREDEDDVFGVVVVTSSCPNVFGVEANSVPLRNFNTIKNFSRMVASLASVQEPAR